MLIFVDFKMIKYFDYLSVIDPEVAFLCEHSCIPEAIASVMGEDDAKFLLMYRNNGDEITYLPNPPAWSADMLENVCAR